MAAIALDEGAGVAALGFGGCVFSREPMIKNMTPMPTDEMNSDRLRPRVSARKNTKSVVETSLTMP